MTDDDRHASRPAGVLWILILQASLARASFLGQHDETMKRWPWLEWLKSGLGFDFYAQNPCHSGIPMTNWRLSFRNPRVFGWYFDVVLFWKGKNTQTFQNMWSWMKLFDSLLPNSQGFFSTEVCSWLLTNPNNRLMNAPSKLPGPSFASSLILPKDGEIWFHDPR